ncbi:hypothetical protein, partial [Bacillus cereus group sp. BC329]
MQEAAFRFQQSGGFTGQQSSGSSQWQQPSNRDRLADAFSVLGVNQDADVQTIKRAYRKLMNEH